MLIMQSQGMQLMTPAMLAKQWNEDGKHLVWAQESYILPQLAVAAVLTVRYEVNEARSLLTHWKSLTFHLIHPPSGHKPNHLQCKQQSSF